MHRHGQRSDDGFHLGQWNHFLLGGTLVEPVHRVRLFAQAVGHGGQFSGSVIILGGCETMPHELLAEALVKRGASSVIGWNELINSSKNDRVMTSLLEEILVNGLEIDQAIDLVTDDFKNDKKSSLKLKHYSSSTDVEI